MSIKKITVLAFVLLLIVLSAGSNAAEDQQSKVGQFASWVILKGNSGGQTYCYAFSEPDHSWYSKALDTRSPYLLMVYKGYQQITFSSHLGFEINKQTPIMLEIDDSDILLDTTPPYSAKTYSSTQDIQILNAIVEGDDYIKVKSFTKYGQYVADYYKVDGILKAINFMEKNCN